MEFWYSVIAVIAPVLALIGSAHAVLAKRDSRSALTWVALLWLVPVLGAGLYLLFGINRINRRAAALRRKVLDEFARDHECGLTMLRNRLGPDAQYLEGLAQATNRIVPRPLVQGNSVEPLMDGDEAYPAMIAAIDQAERTVTLATYIFGNDDVGHAFADALQRAVARGVEVRVLIDNAGERYTWPSMVGDLQRRGVPVARFFPGFPARLVGINLRNHRKLLVVDGCIGFTGGMNIRHHHYRDAGRRATLDLHFRVEGPVVRHLQETFYEDWLFATEEELDGPGWFPELTPAGTVVARGVPDGPDHHFLNHQMALQAAVTTARESVRIVTPYFLPEATLAAVLNTASIRGVTVDIVLPEQSNLPFVHWAMMGQIRQVLIYDCRVWLTPKPFDHTKLMVVDDAWVFVGSSNWDPRSLRLNFEFNLECFDRTLAHNLSARVDERIRRARPLTCEDVDERPLPERLRDGVARLAMPYL
ncbi:phospholipase D-like domain-containing protein [Aquisalimonas sp.]|uniref:phospholipase D-like domain-containing protein n=1 Tax=Aquisalimonas sp. TaxID=1872621 RepID=UPI0025C3DD63|nr:phospholipase D-like domain-containing protein [Aquisalimonas sp.]